MNRVLSRGFTLLETLMAVTILALIITSIYRTWNTALSGWKRATDVSDVYQRQRVVMEALDELTKSVVFANNESGLYSLSGQNDPLRGASISFVTASDLFLPANEAAIGGLRRVGLTLMRDAERGSFLAIQNRPALLEGERADSLPPWHVLATGVIGFFVRYRSPLDGSWSDTWEDESFIPAAVEYTVVFEQRGTRTQPLVVTRAVELPSAEFALQTVGARMDQSNTTNEVVRPEIDLSKLALAVDTERMR